MRQFICVLTCVLLAACGQTSQPGDGASAEMPGEVAGEVAGAGGSDAAETLLQAEDPPAPEGWAMLPGVTATKYQDTGNPLNVLRVYQPVVTDKPVKAWFETRRKTLPDGLTKVRVVPEIIEESGLFVGYVRAEQAGAPVAVISYGCRAGGGVRFAELITAQDDAVAQPANAAATRLFTDVCREAIFAASATPVETSAPGARAAVQAAGPISAKNALKEKDIALVLYSWDQAYRVTGYEVTEEAYLLMKDGSARSELPVLAPADFDLAADRAQNPQLWGKWKKSGKDYQFKFAGGAFETPPGQIKRQPGKRGERLQHNYEESWSVNYGQTGSVRFWNVQMNKDGTFRKSSHGQTGGVLGYGDEATGAMSASDDTGSSTVVYGPSIGGGSSSSTGVTEADLSGTYEIDGYTLTLKYDSGRVVRSFFYISEDRTDIWFEGDELSYINLDD
jgi:hypothetical protein